MTFEEIIILREKLFNDEITFENAQETYFKETKKSWHKKDWKERREAIIKDKCEQCGSTDTLILQHFSHPKKYQETQRSAFQFYYDQFVRENEHNINSLISKDDILKFINNKPCEIKMVCPICSGNFYTRRNAPIHVCTRCKHEFDEPVSKEIPEYVDDLIITEKEKLEIANLKKTSVKFYTDFYPSIIGSLVRKKYLSEIGKMTMLNYLDENIVYLSFKDTKTFCKKCAFNYDKLGKDLCPKCKKNYKQFNFETCFDCLPEDRKKQINDERAYFAELDAIE